MFSGGVRVVDGETPNQGIVEHFVSGSWTRLCANGFDNNAASVVCRELGYAP